MTRRFSTAFAMIALLLLASCAPLMRTAGTPVAQMPRPALWKLADADTVIWLFGTIHALPPGRTWSDSELDATIAGADSLVVETVIGGDPQALATILLDLGTSPGLPPIADRVPADKRALLDAMIERSGASRALLDRVETWAAGLMLMGVMIADLGITADAGVERTLEARFRAAAKPIDQLETPAQQLGYFDSLSEDDQRLFLVTMLDDPAQARAEFTAMVEAWSRGDEAAIAATFDAEFEASPGLREVLLRARNARWTEQLAQRLATPGTSFVAVGAGHLAGTDSVQAMLAARGLNVERVR